MQVPSARVQSQRKLEMNSTPSENTTVKGMSGPYGKDGPQTPGEFQINPKENEEIIKKRMEGEDMIKRMVEGVINEGGEGVVLRRVKSLYSHGRSSDLVKLKV